MLAMLLCLAVSCAGFVAASVASANAPIDYASIVPSTTQAGGHPNLRIALEMENRETQHIPPPSCDCQDARDVTFHLPTGVIGDPDATPRCSAADFAANNCPTDSQIGKTGFGAATEEGFKELLEETYAPGTSTAIFSSLPLYNLVPQPGQVGLFGFFVPALNVPIYLLVNARTESDYGLEAEVVNVTHFVGLHYVVTELWGVPASPEHTADRLQRGCEPGFENPPCHPGVPSTSPERPFIDNPTTCGVPLTASIDILAYDKGTSHADVPYPATTGCDQLSFNPSTYVQPTETATDTATGLDVNLQVPQFSSPTVPSPSEIRTYVLTLPEGLTLNANAADGKEACSDVQARFGTREEAQCPENSKVGTLTLESSALPGPIHGYIYIREPTPEAKFGLVLTADGFNTHVKLAGEVEPNPRTGRLVVSFPNLPQSPFSDFNLHFFGSERALLASPRQCGTFSADSLFTPWDSLLPDQSSSQFFSLTSGPNGSACPGAVRPFAPSFTAGVPDNIAGAHSPLIVNIGREDGEQELNTASVVLPPGFTASLAGISYCPQSAIEGASDPDHPALEEREHPSCPAASEVGSVVAGIGAGTHPVYPPGKVYLAGPYKGAPISLFTVVPGLSGPYDLGDVVDRIAVYVDPGDAQLTAVTDPIPPILQGVVLRIRSLLLQLDRPGFALNPTNCDPSAVNATITGNQGTQASFSPHFQVANCANLGFAPKLGFRISGATKRNTNAALTTTISTAKGEANFKTGQVVLPHSQFLDNANLSAPCTRVQFAANACPASSLVGHAKAVSPLLDNPLEGPVYLRVSSHNLPDLVADLHGQFHIVLDGRVDQTHERIRTTFEGLPDIPVSSFTLQVFGGKHGILVNSENLCAKAQQVQTRFTGQNGRVSKSNAMIDVASCAKKKSRRKRHNERHRLAKRPLNDARGVR